MVYYSSPKSFNSGLEFAKTDIACNVRLLFIVYVNIYNKLVYLWYKTYNHAIALRIWQTVYYYRHYCCQMHETFKGFHITHLIQLFCLVQLRLFFVIFRLTRLKIRSNCVWGCRVLNLNLTNRQSSKQWALEIKFQLKKILQMSFFIFVEENFANKIVAVPGSCKCVKILPSYKILTFGNFWHFWPHKTHSFTGGLRNHSRNVFLKERIFGFHLIMWHK